MIDDPGYLSLSASLADATAVQRGTFQMVLFHLAHPAFGKIKCDSDAPRVFRTVMRAQPGDVLWCTGMMAPSPCRNEPNVYLFTVTDAWNLSQEEQSHEQVRQLDVPVLCEPA